MTPERRAISAGDAPTITLIIPADARRERRFDSQNSGAWDALDYRFSHRVPVGAALRGVVTVNCGGAKRRRGATGSRGLQPCGDPHPVAASGVMQGRRAPWDHVGEVRGAWRSQEGQGSA
jgi:hypothetical protein